MPLDPEIAAHLERQNALPPRASLTVEQTRERMVLANSLSAPSDPVARVEDWHVGRIPVREYSPADNDSLPVVVYFHGGRFFSGNLESHDRMCRLLAVFSGCRVLAVDYRLAPEHPFPAALEDARQVVDHMLKAFGKVGVAGDSAGACLATQVALERSGVVCQALLYPMLDPSCASPSHREFDSGYGPGSDDMKRGWELYLAAPDPRASPLRSKQLRGAPPVWMLLAEYDTLRDEGREYARLLRHAGVDVRLVEVPGVIHGFAGFSSFSVKARAALVSAGEYLFEYLRGERG